MKHRQMTLKTNSRFVFVLLLLVPFILLLAGPAVASKHGESAWFDTVVWGDVTGEDRERELILKKKNNTGLNVVRPGMELDLSFFHDQVYTNGSGIGGACFPGAPGLEAGHYEAAFVTNQFQDGSARSDYFFKANGLDGSEGHKYWLQLFGTFSNPDNFVPSLEVDNGVVTMSAPGWLMVTEGKGKDRKITCTGDGAIDFNVTFTRIR